HPKGQPIHDDGRAMRHRCQELRGARAGLIAGTRKTRPDIEDVDRPTEGAKFQNDHAVIGIATCGRRKVARNGKCDAFDLAFHHKDASYQARAFGDSPTVTRMALSSGALRPSLPARAASAR